MIKKKSKLWVAKTHTHTKKTITQTQMRCEEIKFVLKNFIFHF